MLDITALQLALPRAPFAYGLPRVKPQNTVLWLRDFRRLTKPSDPADPMRQYGDRFAPLADSLWVQCAGSDPRNDLREGIIKRDAPPAGNKSDGVANRDATRTAQRGRLLNRDHIVQPVEIGFGDQQLSPNITSVMPVISADVIIIFELGKVRVPVVFSARSGDPIKQ